jgi:GT2 family glycosyltransferase
MVNVLTVTYNQLPSLKKLYESLVEQSEYLNEWVVFDDESTDGTVEWLKGALDIPTKIIFGKHDNKQLIVGKMNQCMKIAEEGVFILVFGDTWLGKNALKEIDTTYIPNSYGSSYRENVLMDGTLVTHDFRIPPADDVRDINSSVRGWEALPGNGMITTREIMERIGWIDENYPGYGIDDYDTAMRAKMNGAKLIMYNNVKIMHHDHPTKDSTHDNEIRYMNKMRGLGYRYEGKKIKLILECSKMDIRHFQYLMECKKKYPDFKVTLINTFCIEDIRHDWIQMTGKPLPFTHLLAEPYWLCSGDEITVCGLIEDLVGAEFDRLRVREDVQWLL